MDLKQRLGAGVKAFLHPARPIARPFDAEPSRWVVDKLLTGQSALITGAGRNIGRAIALEFAAHGADVYCTDIDAAAVEKLQQDLSALPVKSAVFRSDITRASDTEALCASLLEKGVAIDVLVNNVGIGGSDFQRVLETNLIGPMRLTEAVAAGMIERARPASIIFVSSIHQETVFRWSAGYSASKGALGMLIKELALDYAKHQIRVNGIAPGFVSEDEAGRTVPLGFTPLAGSSINPAYVGRAAVYLAAEYFSRHTTGSVLTIDGGLSLFNYLCAVEAGLKL